MDVQVNLLAVVLAMVSSMVVGMVWYARPVFGNKWIKLAKVDMDKNASAVTPIVLTAVMSLITAYVLAYVAFLYQHFYGNGFLEASLMTALWAWLAFTAARMVTHDLFEGRPAALTVLNIAHELVTFMAMGLIIGLMGV